MDSQKGMDFKHKEVINIKNGKRLGNVQDVTADLKTGTIISKFKLAKHILGISVNYNTMGGFYG